MADEYKVSQVAAEVLQANVGQARVAAVAAEVLRSVTATGGGGGRRRQVVN